LRDVEKLFLRDFLLSCVLASFLWVSLSSASVVVVGVVYKDVCHALVGLFVQLFVVLGDFLGWVYSESLRGQVTKFLKPSELEHFLSNEYEGENEKKKEDF